MEDKHTGTIKGHYWVELTDGRKIDPHFKYYDALKYSKNLVGKNIYRECDMDTQRENIRNTILPYMMAITKSKDEDVKMMIKRIKDAGANMDRKTINYEVGCCHINAIINKMIYGKDARIVYGDLGWKRAGTNEIYYEYEDGWDGELDYGGGGYDMEYMIQRLIKKPEYLRLIMGKHKPRFSIPTE